MSPYGAYYVSTASTTTATTVDFTTGAAYYLSPQWVVPPTQMAYAAPPVVRRRAPLEFNKYINASDLLEEFIGWLGTQDVRQSEVLELPVELFVKWLIIRACEQDREEPNVTLELPSPKSRQPRCQGCGKFMTKGVALPMHDARCADFYFSRQRVAA